jgi:hypothetical protein
VLTLVVAVAMAAAPTQAIPPINTKCPVDGCKVDAECPVAVVNRRAYFVCCGACKAQLEKTPGTFLNKDGTPKNR